MGTYATGVLLLDPNNPARVLRRTATSIFEPTTDFERHGFVPDVVFPTGIVEVGRLVPDLLRSGRFLQRRLLSFPRAKYWSPWRNESRGRHPVENSQAPGRSARSSTEASASGRWLPIKTLVPSISSRRTPRVPRAMNALSPSRPDRTPQNP